MNGGEQQTALEHARQGDTAALGALLDSFRPYVRYLVRALGCRRIQARVDESDLLQDALLAAHRGFGQFRGHTVAELTAWLRQIVRRTVGHSLRDHLESEARALGCEQAADGLADQAADSGSSPSAQAIRHEEAARLAAALARLPEDMQQVLIGRHLDDLPYAALAQQLGRSEAAVRVLYTRALRRLREECAG
jgi:RNA polymerase sigma-70 factor (ECF subfamily)